MGKNLGAIYLPNVDGKGLSDEYVKDPMGLILDIAQKYEEDMGSNILKRKIMKVDSIVGIEDEHAMTTILFILNNDEREYLKAKFQEEFRRVVDLSTKYFNMYAKFIKETMPNIEEMDFEESTKAIGSLAIIMDIQYKLNDTLICIDLGEKELHIDDNIIENLLSEDKLKETMACIDIVQALSKLREKRERREEKKR